MFSYIKRDFIGTYQHLISENIYLKFMQLLISKYANHCLIGLLVGCIIFSPFLWEGGVKRVECKTILEKLGE